MDNKSMRAMTDGEREIAQKKALRDIKHDILWDIESARKGGKPVLTRLKAQYVKSKAKFVETVSSGKEVFDVFYAKLADKWVAVSEVSGRNIFGRSYVEITDEDIAKLDAMQRG